jgi:CRISPR/Cas system-associated exonuclease Cas4 (RecB family)
MSETLTHSRMACYRTCPRKHWIRYELGIAPEEVDFPRRVGSAFHVGLEAIAAGEDPEAAVMREVTDVYDQALVAAMIAGYENHYAFADNPAIEAVELEFDLLLKNPETGRSTPNWRLGGKIDKIVRLRDGRLALMEHKTTSRDFTAGSDYWVRLHMDMQLSIYLLAAREMGYDVQTILYDVTRRPGLRPYKATPEDKRKYTKEGTLYKGQRDVDETPEEYAERIVQDMADRPEHYFARIEIARLDQHLLECQQEVWQQQLALRSAQTSGHWYRNPNACFTAGGSCEYLPICQNSDLENHVPAAYRTEKINPELSGDATSVG